MGQAVAKAETQEVAVATPMAMLDRALSSGATPETLEKLLNMQERWEKSQARKAFDTAIAEAKAKLRPVARNREGHNNKRYADFAAVARAVDGILSEHGLSYRFRSTQNEKINVTCILSHRDGHSEETTLSGPADTSGSKNAIQAIGSTLTYLQRYSLMQALGLAASDDDDGALPITDEQAEEITKLIADTKSNVTAFLKYIGAPSIADIPASKFAAAKSALEAKKPKQPA
jgi:hypothetical protein